MSRVYRIRVRESVRRHLRASDHVGTQLELLEILPAEQLAGLLTEELQNRGFEQQGSVLVRKSDDGVTITVDPQTATVTVEAEAGQHVELEAVDERGYYDRGGKKQAEAALRKDLQADLQRRADLQTAELQKQVTDRLEGHLLDLRKELDQVVNRVTAEALKRKAAQLGQIKEMTEDPQSGSLTIVLEV